MEVSGFTAGKQHSLFQDGGELGMRIERKGMLGLARKTTWSKPTVSGSVGDTAVVVVEDTRHSAVISTFMSNGVHTYAYVHTNIYFPHTHVHTPHPFRVSIFMLFVFSGIHKFAEQL